MFTFINEPDYVPGSLWFEFPKETQEFIPGWIEYKLGEITQPTSRDTARKALVEAAEKVKYSSVLFGRTTVDHVSLVAVYASFGIWRVGERGVTREHMDAVQKDIMESLTSYISSVLTINT
jgi:hypothetical protein